MQTQEEASDATSLIWVTHKNARVRIRRQDYA